jgi:hypothetical protein
VKDPQTGIEVLVPATTFKNASVSESRELTKKLMALPRSEDDVPDYNIIKQTNSWGEELPTINSLPSAAYAGSGVSDFNPNDDDPLGPQTFVGYRTVPNGVLIEQVLINTNSQRSYLETLTTSTAIPEVLSSVVSSASLGSKKKNQPLLRTTAVDRLARETFHGLPRIVDRVEDAKTTFSTPLIEPEAEAPVVELRTGVKNIDPEKLPEKGQAFIPRRYELRATGIPCAIPGILNCHMVKYDTVDTTDKVYTYENPKVGMYYISDKDSKKADGTFADDGNTVRIVPIDPDAVDNPPLSIITGTDTQGLYVEDIVYGR